MNIIDFSPSFYCLYIENREAVEQIFLQRDIAPESNRTRIDLFASEAAARRWIESEQEIQAEKGYENMHAIYDRLLPKKIFTSEFSTLMETHQEIDSITFVDENGVRRLCFRDDLDVYGLDIFSNVYEPLHPKEPIFIINRQKELDEKTILQKDAYFVTYPEIATPLFSIGILDWADDLISRRPNDGYYIEQTSLYDLYMRMQLEAEDPGFFILSREEAPHYILRIKDLKKIIDGTIQYA